MSDMYLLLGSAIVLLFACVYKYNSFVNQRNMMRMCFSSIEVQLKKRFDLIPELVEVVKGYAAHERELLESLEAIRSSLLREIDVHKRLPVEKKMNQSLQQALALSEDYPELKADQQFLYLQRHLTEVEEQISAARRAFNSAVMSFNTSVESFPSSLLAKCFGFRSQDYFEILEDERESVSIHF